MEEGLATIKMSEEERLAAIRQQLAQVDLQGKDADTAFLIELIGGVLGLLGLGYIYSGLTNTGLVRLGGLIAFWILFGIFSMVTFGLGTCLAPILWIVQIGIAYVSAKDLKSSLLAAKSGSGGGPAAGPTPGPTTPVDPTEPTEPTDSDQGGQF